jgi:FkbM family methyltransferase
MRGLSDRIRSLARKHLPTPIRKPLGRLGGFVEQNIIYPAAGIWFDLLGGKFRADGCVFLIPRNVTSVRYRACFVLDTYEADERQLIRKFVRPDDSVLELGACLGIVSCVTNRLLKDKSRHVVVEANPLLIPAIHRNRELNGCGFLVENCAASEQPHVTFYLHPVYVVGGSYQRQTGREVRIPGRSLQEMEQRYGPFTVLIIDVEGAESDILDKAAEVLQNVRLVIIEQHEWAIGNAAVERIRQLLATAGLHKVAAAGDTEAWERIKSTT